MSVDPEMYLPDGETCGSCASKERCCALYGAKPENTWCDFYPVKFRKRRAAKPLESQEEQDD